MAAAPLADPPTLERKLIVLEDTSRYHTFFHESLEKDPLGPYVVFVSMAEAMGEVDCEECDDE